MSFADWNSDDCEARLVIKHGYDLSKALREFAKAGKTASVKTLLEVVTDVESRDRWGWTALHLACSKGRVACVKLLLEAGSDPMVTTTMRTTPLHHAIEAGKVEVVRLLLAAGVDAYAPYRPPFCDARSHIQLAAECSPECAWAIVWFGVDRTIALDEEGDTPVTKYLSNTGLGWVVRRKVETFLDPSSM